MAKYEMAQQNGRTIDGEDMIFGINRRAANMIAEKGKDAVINGAIGALMDDNGELMVLSSVDDTFKSLTPVEYAAYAPICGLPEFRAAAVKAALKSFSPENSHIRAVATLGGTETLHNVVSNYSCRGDKLITMQPGSGNPWFLIDNSRPLRPIIWQDRKKPSFVALNYSDRKSVGRERV